MKLCSNFDCPNAIISEEPIQVRIGTYTIEPYEIGTIWITDENGDGCLFEEAKLEEAIKEFYSQNF